MAPSIRTPAVAYFQSATSSLLARAMIIVLQGLRRRSGQSSPADAAGTWRWKRQDAVDPEPVQPRFLDDNDGKDVPRPEACFLLELRQARKESSDVAAGHRMLGHLLAVARSQGGDDPG